MITVKVTADAAKARQFLVNFTGKLEDRTALNTVLVNRLVDELKDHFKAQSGRPNNLGAPSTGFWQQVSDSTGIGEITATGATATIADVRYRIQLFGGTIKPTGGRKFLTIPLVADAHGKRAADYERASGGKLFRPRGMNVLMERSDKGDRSFVGAQKATVSGNRAGRGTYKGITLRAKSKVRAVYALTKQAVIKADPKAFPEQSALSAALQKEANDFVASLTGGELA